MTNSVWTKWIDNLKARYRWTWIGTVEGACRNDSGDYSSYWNLYERGDGKRKSSLINGYYVESQAARVTRARVRAWEKHGPLPNLYLSPSRSQPSQLIVFPGGKGGAA